jgi:hypothetical protein
MCRGAWSVQVLKAKHVSTILVMPSTRWIPNNRKSKSCLVNGTANGIVYGLVYGLNHPENKNHGWGVGLRRCHQFHNGNTFVHRLTKHDGYRIENTSALAGEVIMSVNMDLAC